MNLKNIKMRKLFLFFAIGFFILAGCNENPDSIEENQIIIFFSTKPASSSLLKSTGTEAENSITKVIIFGVDAQNDVIETYPVINNPPSSGIELTISKDVTSLYAIANPSTYMETATPATVSELMSLTGDFTSAPQSPFLMGGMGNVNGNSVNIEVIRAVAKIEIIGKNDFLIESVTVANTPDKGYVFSRETFSVPASSGKTTYPAINSAAPILYVAESSSKEPVQFVITGQYQGKQANYTLVLKYEGQNIDIVRNKHYQVGITPITESNCEITISIPDWDDEDLGIYEIPDENFE